MRAPVGARAQLCALLRALLRIARALRHELSVPELSGTSALLRELCSAELRHAWHPAASRRARAVLEARRGGAERVISRER